MMRCSVDLNNPGNAAPLLNLFGIDVVQHRHISEQALDILEPFTNASSSRKFKYETFSGGDFNENQSPNQFLAQLKNTSSLPTELLTRWVYSYGTNTKHLVANVSNTSDLGIHFGHQLYAREVDYLSEKEWACTAEDILWRRTHLGFRFTQQEKQNLAEYLCNEKHLCLTDDFTM